MKTDRNFTIQYASKSDVGKRRSENQDTVGAFPVEASDPNYTKGQLFIVADGMGGHERGKEASETAVRTISESFYKNPSEQISERLLTAFREANEAIFNVASANDANQKMGTTCSVLVITGSRAYIAHVGDSRVYRINKSGIEKLTADHTQVEEMYRRGILTKKEAKEHPSKSVLSRALGTHKEVEVDIIDDITVRPGDNFLITTDGLAKVKPDEIREIVLSQSPEPACSILVDYANQRGGEDNVSVLLVRVEPKPEKTSPLPPSAADTSTVQKKKSTLGMYAGIVLGIGLLLYAFNIGGLRDGSGGDEDRAVRNSDEQIRLQYTSAQMYTEDGRLDTALVLYRQILRENPLHVGAIEGIDRIAEILVERGDEYRREGNIDEAMKQYTRASELQPQNDEIKDKIQALREPVQQNRYNDGDHREQPAPESYAADEGDEPVESVHEGYLAGMSSPWLFPGLSDNEYVKESAGIRFIGSPVKKKAIYSEQSADVDILVDATVPGEIQYGSFGIIIGYSDERDGEYFLFSVDHTGTFELRQVKDGTDDVLVSIPSDTTGHPEDGMYRLKVKSLGPWIMLYKNGGLLQAWLHDAIIRGNIGLYADPDIEVKFSNIKIQSAINTLSE